MTHVNEPGAPLLVPPSPPAPPPDAGGLVPFYPRGAVYISSAPTDLWRARSIAAAINAEGVAVFLDETNLDGNSPNGQYLWAVNVADHVLVHLANTIGPNSIRDAGASLTRRYIWLVLGAAFARRLRVFCLLDGVSTAELAEEKTLWPLVRGNHPYEMERIEHYVKDCVIRLHDRNPLPTGAGMTVCMWFDKQDRSQAGAVKQLLVKIKPKRGFHCITHEWTARTRAEQLGAAGTLGNAVVVFFGQDGFPGWTDPDFVAHLRRYKGDDRPIILVGLPGYKGTPVVPESIPGTRVWWLDARNTPAFPLEPFLWAVGGYRLDHRPQPVGTSVRTVLRVARPGPDGPSVAPGQGSEQLVREEIEDVLAAHQLRPERVVARWTADGAFLLFDAVDKVDAVAVALSERVRDRPAQFRMGAATGPVELVPRNGGDLGLYGAAVARAIRLEIAAAPCSLLVDGATFEAFPDDCRREYAAQALVPSTGAAIPARRRVFADVPPNTRPPAVEQDRRAVVEMMERLYPESKLDTLMFLLEMPTGEQPSDRDPHNKRVAAVRRWAVSPAGPGVEKLTAELRHLEGHGP